MKKRIYFIFIIFIFITNIFCQENISKSKIPGLIDDIYYELSGVYSIFPKSKTLEDTFSWGFTKFTFLTSVVIELGIETPYLRCEDGQYNIKSVKKISNTKYLLNVMFYNNEDTIIINKVNGDIWFEKNRCTLNYGENKIYYRINGPKKGKNIFFTSKINNLRFRESPTLEGKLIRLLTQGEKLELLDIGNGLTIDGVGGKWVKVKTEKGEVGWCFDAYLEEVK